MTGEWPGSSNVGGMRSVLITGAAGRTGLAVTAACAARELVVRAFVPGPVHAERTLAAGAREVAQGRFADESALMRACLGIDAIYHMAPHLDPDEVAIGARVIAAARATGVPRLVYHSVLHPQIADMPHHWRKMRVEDLLLASGLEVSVLQPALYMQDIVAQVPRIRETGLYVAPLPIETRLSLVDIADVAAIAARVLAEDTHGGASYELVGTPPLSRLGIAGILSRHLHMPVRALEQSLEHFEAGAQDMPAQRRESLQRMFAWQGAHGFIGNRTVLRLLLGREPTGLEACLARGR